MSKQVDRRETNDDENDVGGRDRTEKIQNTASQVPQSNQEFYLVLVCCQIVQKQPLVKDSLALILTSGLSYL